MSQNLSPVSWGIPTRQQGGSSGRTPGRTTGQRLVRTKHREGSRYRKKPRFRVFPSTRDRSQMSHSTGLTVAGQRETRDRFDVSFCVERHRRHPGGCRVSGRQPRYFTTPSGSRLFPAISLRFRVLDPCSLPFTRCPQRESRDKGGKNFFVSVNGLPTDKGFIIDLSFFLFTNLNSYQNYNKWDLCTLK